MKTPSQFSVPQTIVTDVVSLVFETGWRPWPWPESRFTGANYLTLLPSWTGNMAAIMEVADDMTRSFQKFEPAPRRGEPEVFLVWGISVFRCSVQLEHYDEQMLKIRMCHLWKLNYLPPVQGSQVTRQTPDYFLWGFGMHHMYTASKCVGKEIYIWSFLYG